MLIDLHAHVLTRGMTNLDPHWGPAWDVQRGTLRVGEWFLGTKKLPDMAESEKGSEQIFEAQAHVHRRKLMARLGVGRLVLSIPAHMYMYWAGDFGIRFANTANTELAAYCAEDANHFSFWATLPMAYPEQAAVELERAVKELGAVGFGCGGHNYGGRSLFDPEFDILWRKVSELGVPVFVHGYNQSVTWGANAMSDPFDTTSIVGMCYDEAIAFWHLICGGVLDRFPDLRFYLTHAGGFVPYQLQRLIETNVTMAPDARNRKPVDQYLPNFYFDLLTHSPAMRGAIVEVIGADRLLYGTNFMGSDSVDFDLTEGIGLAEVDRQKIRSGNAMKLLRL